MKTTIQGSLSSRCDKGWVLLVRDKTIYDETPNKGSQHPDPSERNSVDGEARGLPKAVEEVAKTKTNQVWLIPVKNDGTMSI